MFWWLGYYIFCGAYLQDPAFYEFLKEHDKDLLEFDDEDIDVSQPIL